MDKKAIQDKMKALLDKADAEKRNFTEEEETLYTGYEARLAQLELAEKQMQKSKRNVPLSAAHQGEPSNEYQERGIVGGLADYRSLFGRSRRQGPTYSMAEYVSAIVEGRAGMLVGDGASGGWAAPETWTPGFFSAVNAASVCIPRCRVIPFDGASKVHQTAWDSENQQAGFFGGVAVEWQPEGGEFTPVSPKVRTIEYEALKCGMFCNVSREAGATIPRLVAELGSRMTMAAAATFDEMVISGSGSGEPEGITVAASTITETRSSLNSVLFTDIAAMLSRLHPAFHPQAVWLCNPSVLPYLLTLTDSEGNNLWFSAISANMPNTLAGKPLLMTDKCPPLGTPGDLILVDLSAYGFAISQDVVLEKSNSPEWYKDLLSFRTIMRADGKPLMDAAITPRTGGSTLSWAVMLS